MQVFFDANWRWAKLAQDARPGPPTWRRTFIAQLRANPWTKRAVVTLDGSASATVPCLNASQFLVRDGAVQTAYFARGQDAFKKFYADALCLARMAQTVARGLDLPVGDVSGFIGSCHVYHADLPAIQEMLARVT